MSSSLMWLLAGLSFVLAVGWRCQFLATRDSPWGKLQHGMSNSLRPRGL